MWWYCIGLFWNILPHLCYRIVPYWFVHSETDRYLRFISQNTIVFDTCFHSLLPIILLNHLTAFSPLRVMRPLYGLLTHIYYGIISFWEFHLEISFWELFICACRTALRSSACWHLMGRLTAFGLYYLIGRFAAFWSICSEIFILGVCLDNFHIESYLDLLGHFATFCLLAQRAASRPSAHY